MKTRYLAYDFRKVVTASGHNFQKEAFGEANPSLDISSSSSHSFGKGRKAAPGFELRITKRLGSSYLASVENRFGCTVLEDTLQHHRIMANCLHRTERVEWGWFMERRFEVKRILLCLHRGGLWMPRWFIIDPHLPANAFSILFRRRCT